jgi:hypothetical protein
MDDENTVVEDGETAEIAEVLEQARTLRTLRGLKRPRGLPAGGWYSRQPRPLKDGARAVYLMYRWRDPESDKNYARSLGRLN